jgi:hypothetical protein
VPGGRLNRWLVFVHRLPATPSNARVKTWRRLQQIGAVAVKNAVYVLPNTPEAREDLEWLRTEVLALGGEANLFETSSITGVDERRLLAQIRKARPSNPEDAAPQSARRRSADTREYQHRIWVTRPRPGVDRFSSAWLIRRFIDPSAQFVFASSPDRVPDAIPFDMYQSGGFKHEGERCTFEVLIERFGIAEPAVRQIADIVHDLDLKDDRFRSDHAPTIGLLVEGLRASVHEDVQLLDQGIALFEALYQSLRPGKNPKPRKSGIC